MSSVLIVVGMAWIACVAVPVLVLLVEVLAARRPAGVGSGEAAGSPTPSYVVLMPAHDEEAGIGPAVAAVMAQIGSNARLLVVADNCSDQTAERARAAGAEVVERRDPLVRGKGHALAFGVARLREAPPSVVIVLDADCVAAAGTLDLLARAAARLDRPVQAEYVMLAQPASALSLRLAAFAWAVKNLVRPLGLHRLAGVCQLMGSGMAFPWPVIASADLASAHLTEDLQLGVKLAAAGHPPCFCPQARVESWFPEERSALRSQRRRWEHGHLSMIPAGMAVLARSAWRQRSASTLALALDLCVPPLALLSLLLLVSCAFGLLLGGVAAAAAAASVLGFVATVILLWRRAGRQWITLAELARVPAYVIAKLPMYAAFLVRRQREWVRTSRRPRTGD